MHARFSALRQALFWGAGIVVLLSSSQAIAAERVVLKYRFLRESVPVRDLSNLARTGETSLKLQAYLALARQDPQNVRTTLNREVKVNQVVLDRVLNTFAGEFVLDQIGQVIHTPSRQADRQALRSALVLSARGDNTITLIEVMENYPTEEIHVEGDRLEDAARQLTRLGGRLQDLLSRMGRF